MWGGALCMAGRSETLVSPQLAWAPLFFFFLSGPCPKIAPFPLLVLFLAQQRENSFLAHPPPTIKFTCPR